MYKNKNRKPARSKLTTLSQICNLIPPHLVSKLATQTGVASKARSFSPWSHVVSLLYAHLTHAIGLNDVCDSLQLHSGPLSGIRGATPPSRNGLSHANKHRNPELAQELFWKMLDHLKGLNPSFGGGRLPRPLRRFARSIHVIDSTTIELVAHCMDWAKHRRRKAAAKTHMRLNLQSFLPSCVIIDPARHADAKRAQELCAGLKSGEIVIFDKAYNHWDHLHNLGERGVYWVGREKKGAAFELLSRREVSGDVHFDEEILIDGRIHARRIEAEVLVDGKWAMMTFITNNLQWSAKTICELYKARWAIEVFFKQIKQTLNLSDFLGHSAKAVRWQIWTALLVYVLLRFLAHVHGWNHSFVRLLTVLRAAVWSRFDLVSLLKLYGTAGGCFRHLACPQSAYFPGFEP